MTVAAVPLSLVRDPAQFGGREAGRYLRGAPVVRGGRLMALEPGEGDARLVLPRLVEPHVHLDKCHTVDRIADVGGDLRAAIAAQSEDKALWSAEDVRARGARGLRELVEAGCGAVRSHVDWSGAAVPVAWSVLNELAQEAAPQVHLHLAALTALSDLADPVTGDAIARVVAQTGGALGAFVLDQPDRRAGIRAAFALAEKYGLALDFHVDEGLAEGLDGLGVIAEVAIETGFEGPILCGHACSLMNLQGSALARRIEQVARAGITVCVMPSTNLYLQGRVDGTPDRRGLTRVRELRAGGVEVVVGTDNVRDAFCPLGRHDPRASLALAVIAGHLDPPLADYWPMITTGAARAMGLEPVHIDGAAVADLLIADAPTSDAVLTGGAALRPFEESLQ